MGAEEKKRNLKNRLKKELWLRWDTPEHPAEWDGNVFGGGKCSQRFWEYLFVIDNLQDTLCEKSVILDVGSGITNFLPNLLRKYCRCIAVDPSLAPDHQDNIATVFNAELVNTLSECAVDAVTCVSVLEHMEEHNEFITALDLIKAPLIITFEYGPSPAAFQYQLTMEKVYQFSKALKNHYVTRIEKSPVVADNSNGYWYPLGMVFFPI